MVSGVGDMKAKRLKCPYCGSTNIFIGGGYNCIDEDGRLIANAGGVQILDIVKQNTGGLFGFIFGDTEKHYILGKKIFPAEWELYKGC